MPFKSLPQNNSRRPERVAPLAKLPVFWALEGKRVIVAGGSDGAAWKAELLAACGADVEVFCAEDELSDTFRALLEEQDRMVLHSHCWHIGIFENAALALADCETEDEAKAFYCAAKAAGVPVNVIDKPAYCQFQFGSIVNRSPVVVAISTDGAAPILGQAIRRRIETLLPLPSNHGQNWRKRSVAGSMRSWHPAHRAALSGSGSWTAPSLAMHRRRTMRRICC